MALLGLGGMSDLSPQRVPKQTLDQVALIWRWMGARPTSLTCHGGLQARASSQWQAVHEARQSPTKQQTRQRSKF